MARMTGLVELRRRMAAVDRWSVLFILARAAGAGLAVGVFALGGFGGAEPVLVWLAIGYAGSTAVLVAAHPRILTHPATWAADMALGLLLVLASGDWAGPFFLLALTALAPPASILPLRRVVTVAGGFAVAYLGVALVTGLDPADVQSTVGIEILATRLALVGLVAFGFAYAGDALRRLEAEQRRTQRLAVEAERRRIAWELHDSAKQRLHAAHLVLSAQPSTEAIELVLEQLRGATADMETSLTELHSPLEDRDLTTALRERAGELGALDGSVRAEVGGTAPPLDPVVATHAFRIVAEAMTNAVRHAEAKEVRVELGSAPDGGLLAAISDDGRGLPPEVRPGAQGLHGMHSRAFAIGGRRRLADRAAEAGGGRGTRISLEVPDVSQEVPA